MRPTYVDACIAKAEAAGWSGEALQGLLLNPRSATPDGFRALLTEANEIRGLVKILGPLMRAAGYNPDGAAEYFVSRGCTAKEVREDAWRIQVELDEATTVNTAISAPGKTIADPYAARAAQVNAHKAKTTR